MGLSNSWYFVKSRTSEIFCYIFLGLNILLSISIICMYPQKIGFIVGLFRLCFTLCCLAGICMVIQQLKKKFFNYILILILKIISVQAWIHVSIYMPDINWVCVINLSPTILYCGSYTTGTISQRTVYDESDVKCYGWDVFYWVLFLFIAVYIFAIWIAEGSWTYKFNSRIFKSKGLWENCGRLMYFHNINYSGN